MNITGAVSLNYFCTTQIPDEKINDVEYVKNALIIEAQRLNKVCPAFFNVDTIFDSSFGNDYLIEIDENYKYIDDASFNCVRTEDFPKIN